MNTETNTQESSASTPARKAPAKKPAKPVKKAPAKKASPKATAKKPSNGANGVPLKRLLPSGMDAKIARRKLRAAGLKGHDPRARWEFSESQVAEVKKILGA